MSGVAKKFVIVFVLSLLSLAAQAQVKVGVLAPRGELEATGRWAEFGKYLGQAIGQPVAIVPLNPSKVVQSAQTGAVDFVLSHAAHTIVIQERFGGEPLATLESDAGTQFGGVIVAKKGSGISRVKHLKGRNVMGLDKSAAGGYIFQAYYLMQNGINPRKDLASLKEGKKQDDLVLAVDAGLIDAAFVRTGVLEQMAKEGKIRMEDFEVVDRKSDDGFALAHTTPLYPEWYILSAGRSAPELTDAVKTACLKLPATSAAAQTAKVKGFVAPLPLEGMKEALRALKLPPYAE